MKIKRNILSAFFLSILIGLPSNGFPAESTLIEGLRDVKAPVYFPSNTILLIAGMIIILAGGIFVLVKILRAKKETVEEESVDPRRAWEIAYDQFDELQKSSYLEEGQFKTYYSQLSGIIRMYFENQFEVKAPDMTTEEFLWSLDRSQHLTVDQNDTLKQFLDSCDIVKFAKFIPHIEEGEESFQLAKKLVEETRDVSEEVSSDDGT